MKYSILTSAILALLPIAATAQTVSEVGPERLQYKTFSVLGDSYSTFVGKAGPASNAMYYPREGLDVYEASQTWWMLFQRESGIQLEQNDSFSGGTICNTWWNGDDASTVSFVHREQNLREADLFIIEGGTNDSNAGSPIGNYKYADWTAQDLKAFRPALAKTIDYLQQKYPEAQLLFMLNNGLKADINTSVSEVCAHYDVPVMTLSGVAKALDHPTYAGMQTISHQLVTTLLGDDYIPLVESATITRRQAIDNAKVYFHLPLQADRWTAVCLPFSLSSDLVEWFFGSEAIVAEYTGEADIDADDPTAATMHFRPTTTIETGVPYLVRPSISRTRGIIMEDFTLPASTAQSVRGSDFSFMGNYRVQTVQPTQTTCFLIQGDGTLDNPASTATFGSMRAYVIAPKGIATVRFDL